MTVTFELGRESARVLAKFANRTKTAIGVVCQINPDEDNPAVTTGLYKYGVIADVLSVIENEQAPSMAIVRSRGKFRIIGTAKTGDVLAFGSRKGNSRDCTRKTTTTNTMPFSTKLTVW